MRPSQIPISCPGSPGCGKDGAFIVQHPPVEPGGARRSSRPAYGLVKTDLAFDLFGSDGGTNIHWLRAWAEMGMYGVGQTDSKLHGHQRSSPTPSTTGVRPAWCSCATRSSASRRSVATA